MLVSDANARVPTSIYANSIIYHTQGFHLTKLWIPEGAIGGYVGAGYGIHRLTLNEDGASGSATIHGPVM